MRNLHRQLMMACATSGYITGAQALGAGEANKLSLDFQDQSAHIIDTVTPANDYIGVPSVKTTYTSPSTKWILGSNGLYESGTTIRTEWSTAGSILGTPVEEARVNVCLHNRDLTNAAWTKVNTTAAKDQTGIDGVVNSASSITATAGNGTCLQAIVLASSARYQTAFVKRITGSGTVNMTMDAGLTWTAVTVTSSWTRVTIPTQTLANPTVGFRIVTSGDAIAVDFSQNENGTFPLSPIETAGAAVTRNADLLKVPDTLFNCSDTVGTLFVKFNKATANLTGFARLLQMNNADAADFTGAYLSGASVVTQADNTTIDAGVTTISGNVSNKVAVAFQSGAQSSIVNSAAVVSTTSAFTVAFDRLQIGNSTGAAQFANCHVQQVLYVPRKMSNAEIQALTA